MRTYTKVRCPHCGQTVEFSVQRGTASHVNIGTPIDICPHCNKPFKRTGINEWLFLEQKDRDEYLKFGEKGSDRFGMWVMIVCSSIISIVAIGCSFDDNFYVWIPAGIFWALTLWLYIIPHAINSRGNKERKYNQIIIDSFERCDNEDYLKVLKFAGYKLNKIDSDELGINNMTAKYNSILNKWNNIKVQNNDFEEQKTKSVLIP